MSSTISNADAANQALEAQREKEREQQRETAELYGKAQDLFDARSRDTFTVERHGVEIEFLYPDPETQQEFEDRQQAVLEKAQDDADLFDLLEEAEVGIEQMEETLSEHAVDPSFNDPSVWRETIGFTEDEISTLYQDFLALGEGEEESRRLEMLQSLLSDGSSSG
ncbi:hypothetical protein NP511_02115 [Natrinema thermotolerans]|uniref:Uncharacterized protein n=1 Tax=Natrinema thermotolerans TaxID=121872 RepID=A0AAF0PB11_9EURY|nr:hypothetical protein [Natrinema thermotolerans]WPH65855.1 hypothetical protein HJTV4_gp32 [Haloarchaeal virus HJTV-4]QCC60760.1 hypothetical protein DVR14_19805 [Natrinema thermotolerans]QCC61638.1 hypothetical protein DVR14_23935 [Natrinema thermotolerans]WMT07806.1 hypothetical protein NP511_20830 [Natrinema thermotolerans]WMT08438.1 hypothetical protein NP511_02115 [Natrinema thermotolerans]